MTEDAKKIVDALRRCSINDSDTVIDAIDLIECLSAENEALRNNLTQRKDCKNCAHSGCGKYRCKLDQTIYGTDYVCRMFVRGDAADLIERLSEELDRLKEKPLQKPLTLEEACESKEPCVYLEQKDGSLFAAWVKAYEKTMLYLYSKREDVCAISTFAKHELFEKQKYNKTWRCWATNPTDEERKAAKWDE